MRITGKFCVLSALALMMAGNDRAALQSAHASSLSLNFGSAVPGTVLDTNGNGTGFPTRLPNTGGSVVAGGGGAGSDAALTLNPGNLTISVNQGADLNNGTNLGQLEALGVQLSSLGYTGSQDFSVSATFTFPSSGVSNDYNQFGVYVGTVIATPPSSSYLTRDGFVNVGALSGQNAYGTNDPGTAADTGATFSARTFFGGDSITATISRVAGVFTETVADTTPSHAFSANVTPSDPGAFLNSFSNLNVGVYATNGTSGPAFSVPVTSFTATVVPEPSSIVLAGFAVASFLLVGYRRSNRA